MLERRKPRSLRKWLLLCGMALLCLAACTSIRRAWADSAARRGSTAALERAVDLEPRNASYLLLLSQLRLERNGGGTAELSRALAANPADSALWIRDATFAEANNETARAERELLTAARISKRFPPRWALANYYFRQGNAQNFWYWIEQSFATGYKDRVPLFRLCWAMTADAGKIQAAIPDTDDALKDYLLFLIAEKRVNAEEAAARAFIEKATPDEAPAAIVSANQLIESHMATSALNVWNALAERKLIPYAPLGPAAGDSLTNGGFAADPLDGGFDWRIPSTPGITARHRSNPGSMEFSFSGDHPEICELAIEYLPVIPGRNYRLELAYRTEDAAQPTGIFFQWTTDFAAARADLPSTNGQWLRQSYQFSVPANKDLVRLALAYQRATGTARQKSALTVRDLKLSFLK